MNWWAQIDVYCERTDFSFWSEPVNAITNLAFILAAIWCGREAARRGASHPLIFTLILIVFCIGIGSFLFHTYATRWAGMADTLPILLFILVYTYAATRLMLETGALVAGTAVIGAMALLVATPFAWGLVLPSMNGSEGYFGVVLLLLLYGWLLSRRGHPGARWLVATAGLLCVSLTFRSIDEALCAAVPLGTHFMWHVMNGFLLGVATTGLIRTAGPLAEARASR